LKRAAKRANHLPYFIRCARVDLFVALRRRGVRVRVFTNSLASTDVPAVHSFYSRLRPALLKGGVELHEMRPQAAHPRMADRPARLSGSSLHAKAIVIDGQHVLLGSMNLDSRSRVHNTEVGVILKSESLAAEVAAVFNEGTTPENAFKLELDETGAALRGCVGSEENGRRTATMNPWPDGAVRRCAGRRAAPKGLF
jgi:putative cardiolipin synthase